MGRLGVAAMWLVAVACGSDGSATGTPDGGGAAANAGGAPEQGACAPPAGIYDASTTLVSGDCGALSDPSFVEFVASSGGVGSTLMRRINDVLVTEIVLAGCNVRLTQTRETPDGARLSVLAGEELAIGADGRHIQGSVSFMRFDAAGAVTCSGTYDLVLSRDGPTGAAAGAGTGGTQPDAGAATEALDPTLLAEVEADCVQTVMCRAQRGMALGDDPIDECVEATARLLLGDAARQSAFIATRERCGALAVCNYYDCATSM